MGVWEYAENGHETVGTELLSSCKILFGPGVEVSCGFLQYLQPEGVKSAYRKRAREIHPDAHPMAAADQLQRLEREFARVSTAYQHLSGYLLKRTGKKGTAQARSAYQQAANGSTEQPYTRYSSAPPSDHLFYKGPIPSVTLKIGRYLYFRGVVSFQSVAEALVWQRKQRPSIGMLARSWGWLDDSTVHRILQSEQVSGRFGDRAVQLGVLQPWQCAELLNWQLLSQERLGSYFVRYLGISGYKLSLLNYEKLQHNSKICSY